MTKQNTVYFEYADENEFLANMMLDLMKYGNTDTPYDLLEMGIFDKDLYYSDDFARISERKTFVEVSVQDLFHAGYKDRPVEFDNFWNDDKILARSAPHWNRKVVTVRVYNTTFGRLDKQYDLVKLNAWFSQKNKSYTDLCLGSLFFEPTKLRDGVHSEWAQTLCNQIDDDEWTIDRNVVQTVIGGIKSLSKRLSDQGTAKMNDLVSMLTA